ncbi:reverse transcriptase [Gossypium australe]|uniref:Reverse transcriptase n=1 Tax=Gossypium australe TaxID=47621 RepID=A0A5B6VBA0_9ROSI|nr:reverse transcriptase [Gossypium australe]
MVSEDVIEDMPFLETSLVHQSKSDHDAILFGTIGGIPRGRGSYHKLMDSPNNSNTTRLLKDARRKLGHLFDVEERYWAQRARIQWLLITDAKIMLAFNQMDPRKAPGIDGIPGGFYREHWVTVGEDVLKFCRKALRDTKNIHKVNNTLLVLIPKFDNPCDMSNFRPISLCRVIYKIISKALANRLKAILSECISKHQSAFVPGRMIHDNVPIAYELVHYLCCSKNGPNKGCVVKLDMSKAYDRVE